MNYLKCSSRGGQLASHLLRSSYSSFKSRLFTLEGKLRSSVGTSFSGSALFPKEESLFHLGQNAECISTPKDKCEYKSENGGSYGGLYATHLSLPPRVVIYDGVCHLCNSGVNWVIKVDKFNMIKFCALQSRAAEPYLLVCGLTQEDVLQQFVFVEGPQLFHRASTAALKVASYLPPPYSALSIFLLIPAPIRDAIYDMVAARRYKWFGRSSECIIPSEELLDRFIDREELLEKLNKQRSED